MVERDDHERFRRIALSFPDTIEGAHMGTPTFA